MKAKKIDHVGIVVKDLDEGMQTFAENFGFRADPSRGGTVERLGIRNGFIPIGESDLEFIQPTSDTGPVATFSNDRGEGMFLLSIAVDDVNAVVEHLRSLGYRAGDAANGVAFVSMRSTHGVNLQLVQRSQAYAVSPDPASGGLAVDTAGTPKGHDSLTNLSL